MDYLLLKAWALHLERYAQNNLLSNSISIVTTIREGNDNRQCARAFEKAPFETSHIAHAQNSEASARLALIPKLILGESNSSETPCWFHMLLAGIGNLPEAHKAFVNTCVIKVLQNHVPTHLYATMYSRV